MKRDILSILFLSIPYSIVLLLHLNILFGLIPTIAFCFIYHKYFNKNNLSIYNYVFLSIFPIYITYISHL